MELLERQRERAALETALAEARSTGRIVLVSGEAGIGKTQLVAAAVGEAAGLRALWGACDPLVTPRPLGPLHDVARQAGGPLRDALEAGASRERLLAALLDALASPPSAVVIEDVHWIDEASLDLVALLGRRLARAPGCLVLTCRSDALARRGDVRRVLAALPRGALHTIEPQPLSVAAVRALAGADPRDAAELHRVTAGNPFFVTEALAAPPGERVPSSVREAVALRVAALPPAARDVVELAAVVPRPAELWLLAATVGAPAAAVDECVRSGMLTLDGECLAFRHDLARRAVLAELGPLGARERERAVLVALEARGGADPARLVHHARQAADAVAVRRLAPAAARAAGAAGGHRQALEHWEAAVAAGGPQVPLAALEGVAVEAYLCGEAERALEARQAVLAAHRSTGDDLRSGEDLRWLSRILWWSTRGVEATARADEAVALLERLPESGELAMALSSRAQLAMLSHQDEQAIALAGRAADLARRLDDRETLAHALTTIGTVLLHGPEAGRGRAMLEEAFALASADGLDEHAARALINVATNVVDRNPGSPRMLADLDRALAFTREHDFDGYVQYLHGMRATAALRRGDWHDADADVAAALALGEQASSVAVHPALVTLGHLQARRGEPTAAGTLASAWRLALPSGELQWVVPAAAARAEVAWLDDDREGALAATAEAHALCAGRHDLWFLGEIAYWRWRATGAAEPLGELAEPYARSLAGDWAGAAAAWDALGCPYDAAQARCDGDDEAALLEALATFDRLGALRPAQHLRRQLRARGLRRVPRGPRPAARADPAGLTPRQAEVLGLLREGATNAEIAGRLVISPKTVDHHVSAVLAKLGAASRRELRPARAQDGAQIPMARGRRRT